MLSLTRRGGDITKDITAIMITTNVSAVTEGYSLILDAFAGGEVSVGPACLRVV